MDETSRIRIEALKPMVDLMERVGKLDDRSVSSVFREITRAIFESLAKGNSTIKLSPSWATAWNAQQDEEAAQVLQGDSDAIDFSVLHTSNKTASGFEGVYKHSNPARGFIAQGRDAQTRKSGKHLGLFPTAAQAAWARYRHYQKHRLPYGKLAEVMEQLAQDPVWRGARLHEPHNEKWLRAMAINDLAARKVILPDLPEDERHWQTDNPVESPQFCNAPSAAHEPDDRDRADDEVGYPAGDR